MEFDSPGGKEKSKSTSRGLVIGLDNNIGEFLHIQESCVRNTSDSNDINDVEEGIEALKLNETKGGQKNLCKSNTFPSTGKVLPSASPDEDGDEELETALQKMFSDEPVHSPHRSLSLPVSFSIIDGVQRVFSAVILLSYYGFMFGFLLIDSCFFIFNLRSKMLRCVHNI